MEQWYVRVADWVLREENYTEFYQGQIVSFGLLLVAERVLEPSNSCEIGFTPIQNFHYRGNARITHIGAEFSVLDIGLSCGIHTYSLPKNCAVGDIVEGVGFLDIDAYLVNNDYFLNTLPPLIYTWHINRIMLEYIPALFTIDSTGKTEYEHDLSKTIRKVIPHTDSRSVGSECSFLLESIKLEMAPRRLEETDVRKW